MGETDDPHRALKSKDVSERAAAARDLAREGSFDDVPILIELALTDKSPSVRLYTAAAAADVAMRTASAADEAQRRAVLAQIQGSDPGHNPSLLMVLAAIPEAAVVQRLGRILRDPRYDVRIGAATALRRMAVGGGADTDALLGEAFATWLAAGRHPPDAILELVQIVGEAGLSALSEQLSAAAAAGRPHGEAVVEARRRLRQRGELESYAGLWLSHGVDVMQPEPGAVVGWWLVTGAEAIASAGERVPLSLADGGARLGELPVRLVWAPHRGEEGLRVALQVGGRAYWRCTERGLIKSVESLVEQLEVIEGAGVAAAALLSTAEGVIARRLQGRLLWRSGRLAEAEAVLSELAAAKKPRAEVWWMLASVRAELGRPEAALQDVARAIEGAPKKCAWLAEATALRDRLSG
ncbi:MAG TPA: tetratricopeptide repeat protein [Deltaproteobacteria bacterium]|nr:tetratricopeptide repeat protein [Deltaproteobacteria bacterium]